MSNQDDNFTVPSDESVRQEIKNLVVEADACLVKIDMAKEQLKEIVGRAKEEFEVPKKVFNKMAKTYHKQNFAEVTYDDEVFHSFFEIIMEGKK